MLSTGIETESRVAGGGGPPRLGTRRQPLTLVPLGTGAGAASALFYGHRQTVTRWAERIPAWTVPLTVMVVGLVVSVRRIRGVPRRGDDSRR